jgi:uncharacterized membrane protein
MCHAVSLGGCVGADNSVTGAVDGPFVPSISIAMAFALVLFSLGAFVYYVNPIAQSIRAVNVIEAVAHETRRAIDENYPPGQVPRRRFTRPATAPARSADDGMSADPSARCHFVHRRLRTAAVVNARSPDAQ